MGLDSQMVWNKKGLLKYKFDFFKRHSILEKSIIVKILPVSMKKKNPMQQNPRPQHN